MRCERGRVSSLAVSVIAAAALAACGRDPIEETQRAWLSDQHAVEKRMIAVRERHIQLQRIATAATAAPHRAKAMLRANDSTLLGIESMIDQHSLERQAAIDADDIERLRSSHEIALRDYRGAYGAINLIDRRNAEIDGLLRLTKRTRIDSPRKPD